MSLKTNIFKLNEGFNIVFDNSGEQISRDESYIVTEANSIEAAVNQAIEKAPLELGNLRRESVSFEGINSDGSYCISVLYGKIYLNQEIMQKDKILSFNSSSVNVNRNGFSSFGNLRP